MNWILFAVAALVVAGPAWAQDATALYQSKNCLTCHSVDQPKMGPSFKSVAVKYAGNAGAEDALSAKLRNGAGHPKIAATDAEIKALVDSVLATK